MSLLELSEISKHFGGLVAVEGLNCKINRGEIVGLIGPNGAGKTTVFNLISKLCAPTYGKIFFKGQEITRLRPNTVCRLGIGRTFQKVRLFSTMTVLENLIIAARYGGDKSISIEEIHEKSLYFLNFVNLREKADTLAQNLLPAEARMVEVARALSSSCELILLDEVVAGLTPTEMQDATRLIKRIRDELGITVFWIEHVMKAIMGYSDRIIVLNYGKKIAEGVPEEVSKDKKVIEAYLGKGTGR